MRPERTAVVHHILLRYFEFYSDKMVLPRHGAQCRIGAGREHPGTPCDGEWCSVEDPGGGVAYIVSWGRKCRCGHLVVPAANPKKCWVVWRVAWVARCTSAGTGGHDVDNDTAAATQQPISTPPPTQDVVIVVIDSGGSSSIGVRVQCIDQRR